MRGLSIETPQGPFKLAAIRFNLENGKIGEFAIEGLDARSPKGPVKVGRFALKSLDIANLLRMSAQFSNPAQKPSPDQLLGAARRCSKASRSRASSRRYKNTGKPVNIDTFNLNWGQFVGPIPSQARLTAKMTDAGRCERPGSDQAAGRGRPRQRMAIDFDLGAAWTESTGALRARSRDSSNSAACWKRRRASRSANVPREVFSINPQQAAVDGGADRGRHDRDHAARHRRRRSRDRAICPHAERQPGRRAPAPSSTSIRTNGRTMPPPIPTPTADRGRADALHRDPAKHADASS